MVARFVNLDFSNVTLEKDGQQYTLPLSKLSPESIVMAKKLSMGSASNSMTEKPSADLPPAENSNVTKPSLTLATGWDRGLAKGDVSTENLLHVLKLSHIYGDTDLSFQNVALYKNIKYLDDAQKSREYIINDLGGTSLGSPVMVTSAGFPHSALSYYNFSGKFDGFTHLQIVFDKAHQVVAVQLTNNTPKSLLLSNHSTQYLVYNFIQNRRKGNRNYAIRYESSLSPSGLLEVKSELVDAERKSREWVHLFMAEKFAKLCIHVIELSR